MGQAKQRGTFDQRRADAKGGTWIAEVNAVPVEPVPPPKVITISGHGLPIERQRRVPSMNAKVAMAYMAAFMPR